MNRNECKQNDHQTERSGREELAEQNQPDNQSAEPAAQNHLLFRLAEKIRRRTAHQQSAKPSPNPLQVFCFQERTIPLLQHAQSLIVLIPEGSIRLFTPAGILDYGPGDFFLSQIDTPVQAKVLCFSSKGDLPLLCLPIQREQAMNLVLDLDDGLIERIIGEKLEEGQMEQEKQNVISAMERLLDVDQTAIASACL